MHLRKQIDGSAIVRLIERGTPKRRAAATAGVSSRTIDRVVAGEHRNPHEYVRCPGCGGKQIMPCQVCQLRSNTAAAA